MFRNIKYLYAVLVIATISMAASAFWLISGVVQESAKMDSIARDTLIGLASQTNYELHQFIYALEQFTPENRSLDKRQLITRYDILWSRLRTNTSGRIGAAFKELDGVSDFLKQFHSTLIETEEQILSLKRKDIASVKMLKRQYRSLTPELHQITLLATKSATKSSHQLHRHLQEVGSWALILLPSMGVTGFLVAAILWRERKSLNNLTTHLEERVLESTLDLRKTNQILKDEILERERLEAKLVQSQKMEMVGQLTGGIAHDFNNLLAIIQGNAELLETIVEEDNIRLITPIIKATARGSDLTQRLLAFSRKQPLHPEAIDMHGLIESISELLDRSLGETIKVKIKADENLWLALADSGQVENAVLNLAVNARHAMPNGGQLSIDISNFVLEGLDATQLSEAAAGDYVLLCVSDTGTGMSKKTIEHAFEPFFTTKDVGKGSGLGLSMVYGFVKQSGGYINLYSEEGLGTSVKIYLPRCGEDQRQRSQQATNSDIPMGNGETILILEDDKEVLVLAAKILQSLNYEVIPTNDTDTALQVLLSNQEIDLILSDVVLPGGMSGPEFFKKNSDIIQVSKIIYMSGYPAEAAGNTQKSNSWDPQDVLLTKPFQRRELATQMKIMLTKTTEQTEYTEYN
ncbi:MAG: response regulator [Sneathiella sp.]|nr:response regulator [Sneathiella sp.]